MNPKKTYEELEKRVIELEKQATEHKQVVEQLRKYKFIVDAADEFMTMIDQNYTYEAANRAYCEARGKKRSEIEGKTVVQVWGEKKLKHVIRPFLEKCFSGQEAYSEDWFKFNDEILKCFAIKYYPYYDTNGHITHAVVISHDITEHKLSETELKKSETLLRNAFEAVPDLMTVHDRNFRIVLSNWNYCDHVPQHKKKSGNLCYEVYMNQDVPCEICHALEVFKSGKPNRLKWKSKRSGKIFEINVYPVFDENKEVIMVTEHIRDITDSIIAAEERKKLELQLQQAQKMESIGTLAGGIAHDFNNILSSVIGYTELALDDVQTGSLIENNLQEVLIASSRAKNLVQHILTFSRQSDQDLKPTHIAQVIKETLNLLRASIPSTIQIQHRIESINEVVLADSTQMHQVLMNLCTNAHHAMLDEGGTLTVSMKQVDLNMESASKYHGIEPGKHVKIEVKDTGHGIPDEIKNRIFEPYFTTKDQDKGTGLGLSVVHGIIKNHRGHISLESVIGKGTVFTVFLPLIESLDLKEQEVVVGEYETGNERILCIDDEEQLIKMQQQMLERLGYHVTIRTSSVEALEAFRLNSNNFDLVITDMTMPNMTGDKLTREIKRINPDIPIILCTGFSEKISKDRAAAIGINDFIMKPAGKKDLARVVRKQLDLKKVNKKL